MKSNCKKLLTCAFFLASTQISLATTVYLSCYENLDINMLETTLSLKNFEVTENQQNAQLDFCFTIRNNTQINNNGRVRVGVGVGHGNYNSRYGGGLGYDPFGSDYPTNSYEQTYLSLQIKDEQGRSIWKDQTVVNNQKKIHPFAKKLINNIPLHITQIMPTTQESLDLDKNVNKIFPKNINTVKEYK